MSFLQSIISLWVVNCVIQPSIFKLRNFSGIFECLVRVINPIQLAQQERLWRMGVSSVQWRTHGGGAAILLCRKINKKPRLRGYVLPCTVGLRGAVLAQRTKMQGKIFRGQIRQLSKYLPTCSAVFRNEPSSFKRTLLCVFSMFSCLAIIF